MLKVCVDGRVCVWGWVFGCAGRWPVLQMRCCDCDFGSFVSFLSKAHVSLPSCSPIASHLSSLFVFCPPLLFAVLRQPCGHLQLPAAKPASFVPPSFRRFSFSDDLQCLNTSFAMSTLSIERLLHLPGLDHFSNSASTFRKEGRNRPRG